MVSPLSEWAPCGGAEDTHRRRHACQARRRLDPVRFKAAVGDLTGEHQWGNEGRRGGRMPSVSTTVRPEKGSMASSRRALFGTIAPTVGARGGWTMP